MRRGGWWHGIVTELILGVGASEEIRLTANGSKCGRCASLLASIIEAGSRVKAAVLLVALGDGVVARAAAIAGWTHRTARWLSRGVHIVMIGGGRKVEHGV